MVGGSGVRMPVRGRIDAEGFLVNTLYLIDYVRKQAQIEERMTFSTPYAQNAVDKRCTECVKT
jgi:hypothetical protein